MFPSKLLLGTDMFTFTYLNVEYETSISSWDNWNNDRTKMILLPLFQLATRLIWQNIYKNQIHNELWHNNLYTNIGISNWHIWIIDENDVFYFISVR